MVARRRRWVPIRWLHHPTKAGRIVLNVGIPIFLLSSGWCSPSSRISFVQLRVLEVQIAMLHLMLLQSRLLIRLAWVPKAALITSAALWLGLRFFRNHWGISLSFRRLIELIIHRNITAMRLGVVLVYLPRQPQDTPSMLSTGLLCFTTASSSTLPFRAIIARHRYPITSSRRILSPSRVIARPVILFSLVSF